jgi:hypothetical protein
MVERIFAENLSKTPYTRRFLEGIVSVGFVPDWIFSFSHGWAHLWVAPFFLHHDEDTPLS